MSLKKVIGSFIATLLLFLSILLFKDLFIDPLMSYIGGDKVVEFILFIISTIVLVYLFHKSVPWLSD